MIIMKVILIVTTILAVTIAAPPQDPKSATIIKYENDNIGIDGYNFAYETSDGVSRSEKAEIRNIGTENEFLEIRGAVSWVANDGKPYTFQFVADENGFQPTGDHLPR